MTMLSHTPPTLAVRQLRPDRAARHRFMPLVANAWFLFVIAWLMVLPAGRFHILVPILFVGVLIAGERALAPLPGRSLSPLSLAFDRLADPHRLWIVAVAGAGLVPVIFGMLRSTPGWKDVGLALVASPLAWLIMSLLPNRWGLDRLAAAIAVGSLITATFMLMLVTGVGVSLVQFVRPGAIGVAERGQTRVNFSGASALIAGLPFLASIVFDSFRSGIRLAHRRLVVFALIMALVAALISGRQGVVGALALTPVMMVIVHLAGFRLPGPSALSGSPESARRLSLARLIPAILVVLTLALIVANALGMNPTQLPRDLLAVVGIIEDSGNARVGRSFSVRSLQAASLIEGWQSSPLVGNGAGAVAPDYFTWRGYEPGTAFTEAPRPWRAELAYHLLLFEAGIVGIAVYLAVFTGAFRRVRRWFQVADDGARMVLRASLVMSATMLVATAANPLARTVGHQWSILLPLIVCAGLHQRSAASAEAHKWLEANVETLPYGSVDAGADV